MAILGNRRLGLNQTTQDMILDGYWNAKLVPSQIGHLYDTKTGKKYAISVHDNATNEQIKFITSWGVDRYINGQWIQYPHTQSDWTPIPVRCKAHKDNVPFSFKTQVLNH